MTAPIEILKWDSRFFGFQIARVKSSSLTPPLARRILTSCANNHIDCLYYLAPSNSPSSIACAEAHGFRLVDLRITLYRDLNAAPSPGKPPTGGGVTYRAARASDVRRLQSLARDLFSNSRFARDTRFPPGAHKKMFAEWIAKSVRGQWDDWVGLAVSRGQPAGFVSCRRLGRGSGRIGLIGVARPLRRHGIGRGLLNQAFDWFRRHQVRHLSVITQGRASGAQRLYEDIGFRTERMALWYHKWF